MNEFRILVDKEKKKLNNTTNMKFFEFSKSSLYAQKCLVQNKHSWPTAKQMNLDKSQYEAVQLVLNNRLALIQGYII